MTPKARLLIGVISAPLAWCGVPSAGFAAENAMGFYLLGSKGPMAGILPPVPGVFFQNDLYVYHGEAGGNIQFPFGGNIISNVDATAVFELPTIVGITPWEILGGRVGFSATIPVGSLDVDAQIGRFGISDDIFTVGDPVAAAMIGWNAGNFHWTLGTLVNFPIGDYQEGEIANIAFHHWGTDVNGALTWLDPQLGIDLSAAAGLTFNDENHATDYETGTEFHLEWAASKMFSPQFNAGLVGYYYNQVTGDSGDGARLGPFEGEVVALGATAGLNFQLGKLPVSTRLKYYHEFDATNRLEGDAGYFTVAMPLWVPAPPAPLK